MRSKKLSSLSIFFPCYNDEKTIQKLIDRAYITGQKVAKSLEVIVVDDGSTDASRKNLKIAQKKYPTLKLVFHRINKGYGGALRTGFKTAKNDFVFYTDGDGQYNVNQLIKLVAKMEKNVDVVNGRINNSSPRDILGNLYSFWTKTLFNIPITRANVAFRLIRKSALDKITLTVNSGAFCIELVSKLASSGAKFIEVPVNHYDRQYGHSQFFTPRRIIRTLIDDLRLFWQLNSPT